MKPRLLGALLLIGICSNAEAHDRTTAVTWNREISRIFYERCGSCHRDGGTAFSLMTYRDVQPRVVDIRNAVLSRQMPPWGAVKGFGDFRNDYGLTQEQIELIVDWAESDARRGNNPSILPRDPKYRKPAPFKAPKNGIVVSGDFTLQRPITVDGLWPEKVADGTSAQVVAAFPDGRIEPLIWFYEYKNAYSHPFLFRQPLYLPSGTVIRGVPPGASILLIPGKSAR